MTQTAAQTKTAFENATQNPARKVERLTVHVSLTFEGVEYKPIKLLEALETLYGASKVSNLKDDVAHDNYCLLVVA